MRQINRFIHFERVWGRFSSNYKIYAGQLTDPATALTMIQIESFVAELANQNAADWGEDLIDEEHASHRN